MTRLQGILEKIQEESAQQAAEIISTAEHEAALIVERAQIAAENNLKYAEQEAEETAADVLRRAKSAVDSEARQALLSQKQHLIDQAIKTAYKAILQMPDGEYFAMIQKMIDRFATGQDGEIVFSEKDRKRLPIKLKMGISLKKNLSLSERTQKMSGGFLLIYGDIEENCSFRALFDTAQDEIKDKVNTLLFNQEG